jgi:hypothetical protein
MGKFRMKEHLDVTLLGGSVSHVQEWPILPESNLSHSIAISGHGCWRSRIHLEDHDESS